jgi:SAM-dependent methyltransferase
VITVDFRLLTLDPGARVLDIGCGSGRHTAAVAQRPGVTAIGADIGFPDLKQACQRLELQDHLGQTRGRWHLCAASLINLPFSDNHFDAVLCAEVLEHLPEVHRAIGELLRVLKPGGALVVSVPRQLPERICWSLSAAYRNSPGGHIRIFRKSDLLQQLEKRGACYRACRYAHSLHTPYWWLKCLLGLHNEKSFPVRLYHRFLIWDMMQQPGITRGLEQMLNPVLGKSLVLYLSKALSGPWPEPPS